MTVTHRLDTVANITMGQAPAGESYNFEGVGLPLIAGAGDFGEIHPVPKKFTSAPGKTCLSGDIILGIRASIGEKVLADRSYCLGRGVAGLRAKPALDDRFLWHWLSQVTPRLNAKAKGATFKQVNRSDIGELSISLPPLAEQQRIAAILDKADALRAKRRAALAKLDELTQSIFLDMFGDPATNPKGWPEKSFGEVCRHKLGKMLDRKRQTGKHMRPYLRNANVRWFGFDLTELLEMDFDKRERAALRLQPGDLLVCEGGEPGRAAVWQGQLKECYFQKALHRARPDQNLALSEYLVWLLWFLARRNMLRGVTSATIAHLTGEKLAVLPVILPPIELQRNFVLRLQKVNDLREASQTAEACLDRGFRSLQQRAFRGEL